MDTWRALPLPAWKEQEHKPTDKQRQPTTALRWLLRQQREEPLGSHGHKNL
jgi:hypothetical protein